MLSEEDNKSVKVCFHFQHSSQLLEGRVEERKHKDFLDLLLEAQSKDGSVSFELCYNKYVTFFRHFLFKRSKNKWTLSYLKDMTQLLMG
jgi:hypothetical protein